MSKWAGFFVAILSISKSCYSQHELSELFAARKNQQIHSLSKVWLLLAKKYHKKKTYIYIYIFMYASIPYEGRVIGAELPFFANGVNKWFDERSVDLLDHWPSRANFRHSPSIYIIHISVLLMSDNYPFWYWLRIETFSMGDYKLNYDGIMTMLKGITFFIL